MLEHQKRTRKGTSKARGQIISTHQEDWNEKEERCGNRWLALWPLHETRWAAFIMHRCCSPDDLYTLCKHLLCLQMERVMQQEKESQQWMQIKEKDKWLQPVGVFKELLGRHSTAAQHVLCHLTSSAEMNRLRRLVSSGHVYFEILTSNKCIYNINHAHKEKTQDCKQEMDVDAILSWALSPPSCCVKSRFNESGVKQRHRKLFLCFTYF